jgi:hypothetical protein
MRGAYTSRGRNLYPGVLVPKDLPPSEQDKRDSSWHKSRLTQPKCPGGGAMASAPRMAARNQA